MNERTRIYFDELAERAVAAKVIPREPFPDAQPNACHANCETFARRFPGLTVVRGWLVLSGCWFMPHSVVRETASGKLIDITPDPSNSSIPFVEHRGTESEFATLRRGRDGGWQHPQPADALIEAPMQNSFDFEENGYTDDTQPFEALFFS